MFKILTVFLFVSFLGFFSAQAQSDIKASEADFLSKLDNVVNTAKMNEWNTVTSLAVNIRKDHEKFKNKDETLRQLEWLKSFVLENKLDENKTKAFLVAYLEVFRPIVTIHKSVEKVAPTIKEKPASDEVVQIVKPRVKVNEIVTKKVTKAMANMKTKTQAPLNQNYLSEGISLGLALAIFLGFIYTFVKKEATENKNKMINAKALMDQAAVSIADFYKIRRSKKVQRKFKFENALASDYEKAYWKKIRPEIYKLSHNSKVLLQGSSKLYRFEEFFSLEFVLVSKDVSVKEFNKLKKITHELGGELLTVTDYQFNANNAHLSRLVMNFSCPT